MSFKNNSIYISVISVFVAIVFIISGLIKLNDPIGFSYKLQEYFEVFKIGFLDSYAVFFAISICSIEVILGAFLLLKFYYKNVLIGLLGLTLFFTFLTFYSAYFEVVKNCGCFGDALPLNPWESFFKDLFLLILIVILFLLRNKVQLIISKNAIAVTSIIVLPFLFGYYVYSTKPIIDFLPYKVGAHLPSLMTLKEGAVKSEYEITYDLENQKTKEKKSISDKEYLKTKIYLDTNWKLMHSSEPRLVKLGDEPVIKDLAIYNQQGADVTLELLNIEEYNFFIVVYDINSTKINQLININGLIRELNKTKKVKENLITASATSDVKKVLDKYKLEMNVLFADAVPLKSMIRSNPGLLLMKKGIVIKKWAGSQLPTFEELKITIQSND